MTQYNLAYYFLMSLVFCVGSNLFFLQQEIPELYRPSEWLSEVIPKKFPYYPQMGDEVMFFAQGYELYIKAVQDRKVYELAKSQLRPWGNIQLKVIALYKKNLTYKSFQNFCNILVLIFFL